MKGRSCTLTEEGVLMWAYRLVGPKLEPLDLVKVPEDVPPLLLQFWKGFWMKWLQECHLVSFHRAAVCLSCPFCAPPSAHRAVLLVSCRAKNLKGSRINKRKAKLQQAFGRHAGSGTVRAHKELTVSVVALRIPAVYSPPTHTSHSHRDGTQRKLSWG